MPAHLACYDLKPLGDVSVHEACFLLQADSLALKLLEQCKVCTHSSYVFLPLVRVKVTFHKIKMKLDYMTAILFI